MKYDIWIETANCEAVGIPRDSWSIIKVNNVNDLKQHFNADVVEGRIEPGETYICLHADCPVRACDMDDGPSCVLKSKVGYIDLIKID